MRFVNRICSEDPNKNDLSGLSRFLDIYNIDNVGVYISDVESLKSLPLPLVVHLRENKAIVVVGLYDDYVVSSEGNTEKKIQIDDLVHKWTGNVLVMEKSDRSIEPNYRVHLFETIAIRVKNIALVLSIVLFLLMTSYENGALKQNLLLLCINIIGMCETLFLIKKQLHIPNKEFDKLCNLLNKKNGCNAALNSSASKILGIGLGEIGFGYFCANTLVICIIPALIPSILFVNLASLLFTIWSVWYQGVRLKQWCFWCLISIALLWCIFFCGICLYDQSWNDISLLGLLNVVAIYLIFIFLANSISALFFNRLLVKKLRYTMNCVKNIENTFDECLKKNYQYDVAKCSSVIQFGKRSSSNILTVIMSPYCFSCAQMNDRINDLLTVVPNICVQYIFFPMEDEQIQICKYLIAAYLQKDGDFITRHIYNKWFHFGRMRGNSFWGKYNLIVDDKVVVDEMIKHKIWLEQAKINATPAILLNGCSFPKHFEIEDLRFLLDA